MDTKKLRQKILDLAIRGKLVPQDPNDEPASVLLERIRAEKERLIKEGKIKLSKKSASDDEIEAPFEIPESWEWTAIGELCDVVRGGSPRPAGSKEFYDGPIPFLKVADLTHDEGIYVYMAQNSIKEAGLSRTRMIEADTLLLTNSGATLGVPKINTFPTTINDGIAAFLFLSNDIKLYVYWFLKSKTNSFRRIDQGAAQPNLNTDLIKAEQMPLPPLSEQRRIANAVEHWFTLIDELESNEGDLLKTIDKAKSKILDLAIHGKLVPQDPSDEPAKELLKRINPKFEACDVKDCPYTIPQSWEWVSGIDIFESMKSSSPSGETFKYIDIDAVDNKCHQIISIKHIQTKEAPSRASRYTERGNVLFSMVRPYLRNIAMVPEDGCIASTGFFVCREKTCLNNSFCLYLMLSNYVVDGLNAFMKGDNSPSINKSQIESFLFPLPSLEEQLRIVAKIEDLFAVLDGIKESLEA